MTYRVNVYREEGFWMVQIPELDLLTQARRLDEVERMARSIISLDQEVESDSFTVSIHTDLGLVGDQIDEARSLRATADEANHKAAKLARESARQLYADGLPLRDVGALLDVSFQRAQQLVKS
ncbi:MAG: hypothetical protein ACRDMV_05770 [Streptosporangiales bacterium]